MRKFSRLFIITGIVLIVAALIYEAVGYPWHTLFADNEQLQMDIMPDPEIPSGAILAQEIAEVSAATDEPEEEDELPIEQDQLLPGEDDSFTAGLSPVPQTPLVVLGAIKIPKLNISVNILQGTSKRALLSGAGLVTGSPGMGAKGNVVIAGHMVTYAMHPFRHLDIMAAGDNVILKDTVHTYVYQTTEVFVVNNDECWVMGKVEDAPYCLTLITCHPVGSARQRMILRAVLASVDDMPYEEYYDSLKQDPAAEEAVPPSPESDVEPAAPGGEDMPLSPETDVEPVTPGGEAMPPSPETDVEPVTPGGEAMPPSPETDVEPVAIGGETIPPPAESDTETPLR